MEKARRSCGLRTFRNGKPADRMTALRISRAQHGRHWLSYGIYGVDMWRGAATYVDRILRGAKPAELPVQFPTKFEMAVNLKTAKALGLTVPPSIRLRADEQLE